MRIREIEHMQLAMPLGKEAEARSFYEKILGIPLTNQQPPRFTRLGGLGTSRSNDSLGRRE
jgi:hypothetical protein